MTQTDYENGHRFELVTSTALKGKAPARFDWAAYYRTCRRALLTPRELAVHVWRGYAFMPVWERARREENFIGAGHVALDFDAGDETSSLDYLMRPGTFAWLFASFGYTTPSHTDEAPRARLVFVLQDAIGDPAEYRAVYQAVAWAIARDGSQTDPSCKDSLRLYYGSPGCVVSPNWSVLGTATIKQIRDEYDAAHPAAAPTRPLRTVNRSPSQELRDWKLRQLGESVRAAPSGQRHNTLLRLARVAGGYVASGAFDEHEATAELEAAAGDFGEGEDGRREVARIVRDGIQHGKQAPLHFEGIKGVGELLG